MKEQETEENSVMGSFIMRTVHQALLGQQMNEVEWVGSVAGMGEVENAHEMFIWYPEE
jgi:hypothetical protein